MAKKYELYHGYNLLNTGTIKELAAYLGVKENTIRYYSTPTYMKRCLGVRDNYYVESINKIYEEEDE